MVVKVYISGISGNKEVKKRQQRVLMILDSKNITYDTLDITEPGKESDKEFMQQNSKTRESKHPLPPQIFNEDIYCGDYEDFDIANENDELEKFLKMPESSNKTSAPSAVENGHVNGNTSSRENSADKESAVSGDQQVPESQESIARQEESIVGVSDNTIVQEDKMATNDILDEHGSPVKDEKMDEDIEDKNKDNDEPAGEE
ncbi:SH3 domain-binding glutamic acid-rich protein-like [Lycorma delicatula]|uniref:SH3 domain-binding glutamic acid-rich protein-like n=1 Tax=Lycorma delicatula TaxID=130591 RepID=UPI003F50E2F8